MPDNKPSRRLAILIDADNTSADYAQGIFDEIAKLGEANVRRIYGDFSGTRLKKWRDILHTLAITPQQVFNYTIGKNAADIALVIHAMDLLHRTELDGFCLVSSDSDFTGLAQRLREDNKVVYGFGQKKTPESFRNACSRFIYLENLVEEAKEGSPAVSGATIAKEPVTKAIPLVRKAMEEAWETRDWIDLATVGQRLNLLAPDFDSRTYGAANLVTVVEKTGQFDVERMQGRGVRIKRK